MPTMRDLAELGQSIWLDYIRRSFIEAQPAHRFR